MLKEIIFACGFIAFTMAYPAEKPNTAAVFVPEQANVESAPADNTEDLIPAESGYGGYNRGGWGGGHGGYGHGGYGHGGYGGGYGHGGGYGGGYGYGKGWNKWG